jgi:hypothetical protein
MSYQTIYSINYDVNKRFVYILDMYCTEVLTLFWFAMLVNEWQTRDSLQETTSFPGYLGNTLVWAGHVPRTKFSARGGVGKVSNYTIPWVEIFCLTVKNINFANYYKFKILANFCLFSLLWIYKSILTFLPTVQSRNQANRYSQCSLVLLFNAVSSHSSAVL